MSFFERIVVSTLPLAEAFLLEDDDHGIVAVFQGLNQYAFQSSQTLRLSGKPHTTRTKRAYDRILYYGHVDSRGVYFIGKENKKYVNQKYYVGLGQWASPPGCDGEEWFDNRFFFKNNMRTRFNDKMAIHVSL